MFSNKKNIPTKSKHFSSFRHNDDLTDDCLKSYNYSRKETETQAHRKKIMRELYSKMMSSCDSTNNDDSNSKTDNKLNDMEVEEVSDNQESKKNLIQKYLNEVKQTYNEMGEDFIYKVMDDNKISFCPFCSFPVVIIDVDKEENNKNVTVGCVNSCFQYELNQSVFNKYSMDNVIDLYVDALKRDNKCNHNEIGPITSGEDGILFTCMTCLFDQFK